MRTATQILVMAVLAVFHVGCEPVVEDYSRSDRFADFEVATTVHKEKDSQNGSLTAASMSLHFVLTRVGAYYVEPPFGSGVKFTTEAATSGEKVVNFPFFSNEIRVTFSDGKVIERTVVKFE